MRTPLRQTCRSARAFDSDVVLARLEVHSGVAAAGGPERPARSSRYVSTHHITVTVRFDVDQAANAAPYSILHWESAVAGCPQKRQMMRKLLESNNTKSQPISRDALSI